VRRENRVMLRLLDSRQRRGCYASLLKKTRNAKHGSFFVRSPDNFGRRRAAIPRRIPEPLQPASR